MGYYVVMTVRNSLSPGGFVLVQPFSIVLDMLNRRFCSKSAKMANLSVFTRSVRQLFLFSNDEIHNS